MKKTLILIAALAVCHLTALAGERIHIQTDKDRYVSGELVWMKLITTTGAGVPLSLSKVGYVELVDGAESRVRVRADLTEGIGSATLLLPSTLPTGYYRLVGYTRYMRNFGQEAFFEKRIAVVNPAQGEVPRGGSDITPYLSESTPPFSALTISGNREAWAPRSEVRLALDGIPEDIHTLSVSVVSRDLAGQFPTPGLGAWKKGLAESTPPASATGGYEAEYEGQTVTGKLVSADTGEAVRSASVTPLLGFPGDAINLFGGKLRENGDVTFLTSRTTGFGEAATSMRGNDGRNWRIDLDSPYTGENLARPVPTFPLETIDREMMLRQSLALQIQYSYANDSLMRFGSVAPHFSSKPDKSYIMEEWTRFATMDEVVTEFVFATRFSRAGGKRYLSVVANEYGFSQTHSLVLLDGIPVIDHDLIYNYNPLLLSRIDVYFDRFIVGSNMFNGVVAFYTAGNSYPEFRPDPFTQIVPYESPQPHRLFYAPDYSDDTRRASRLPDYRHTLYWDADVEVSGGRASVRFFTGDLTGEYQVLVEGLTRSGEPVAAVYPLTVR